MLGEIHIQLELGFLRKLINVVFSPSMRQNLISLARMDQLGFYLVLEMKLLLYFINQKHWI